MMTQRLLNCRNLLLGSMLLHLLLLSGCGYRLVGASPEAPLHFSVAVPIFRNLTNRSVSAGEFTEAVATSLLRQGIRLGTVATADYVVTGEVLALTLVNEAFSAADTATLNKAEAEIEIVIRNRTQDRTLLKERLRRRVDYPYPPQLAQQATFETAALKDLADQVAQVITLRLLTLPQERNQP